MFKIGDKIGITGKALFSCAIVGGKNGMSQYNWLRNRTTWKIYKVEDVVETIGGKLQYLCLDLKKHLWIRSDSCEHV